MITIQTSPSFGRQRALGAVVKAAVLLFLSSCSLKHGIYPAESARYEVQIVNRRVCDAEFIEIQKYLASHGVLLSDKEAAPKKFICIPDVLISWLTPIPVRGVAELNGNVGWSVNYTKIMLHELGHLMWGFEHGAKGIMFPMAEGISLATGFTEKELDFIKGKTK